MARQTLRGLEHVVRGVTILTRGGARITHLAHEPRPLLAVGWTGDWYNDELHRGLDRLAEGLARLVGGPKVEAWVRSTSLDRLPAVLATGVDVVPADAVMAVVRRAGEALEFRQGDERLLLLYDGRTLYPAWKEIPADTDERRLAALERSYPTRLRSQDGSRLWLSRLAPDDPRLTTQVEVEHARWIQGSPWEALLGVVVLGRDHDDVLGEAREAMVECQRVSWAL